MMQSYIMNEDFQTGCRTICNQSMDRRSIVNLGNYRVDDVDLCILTKKEVFYTDNETRFFQIV